MAEKKVSLGKEFSKGIIAENPVLRLALGTCPTLAVTTSVDNAIGMGIAATIVLILSNAVISLLRKVIPNKVRIPAFIVIIAAFVSIIQLFVKAYAPALNDALGIYLPLIVVNCIILGRAEAFASKNKVLASVLDGAGMGIGFTVALTLMAAIREFFGSGNLTLKVLGYGTTLTDLFGLGETDILTALHMEPIIIFILAPGGFFAFGLLIALSNKLSEAQGKKKATFNTCEVCAMAGTCATAQAGGAEVDMECNVTLPEVDTVAEITPVAEEAPVEAAPVEATEEPVLKTAEDDKAILARFLEPEKEVEVPTVEEESVDKEDVEA